jgi:3-deoxy-D-manno-octulosonate 8-phosphate phosphatase (KDO 8-P phosphatase)
VADKMKVLHGWLSNNGLTLDDILYMGDDIPDLDSMKRVGCPTCPADAAEEVKAVSVYMSGCNGGGGATAMQG